MAFSSSPKGMRVFLVQVRIITYYCFAVLRLYKLPNDESTMDGKR